MTGVGLGETKAATVGEEEDSFIHVSVCVVVGQDWMLVLVVLPQMVASLKQPGLMSLMSGTAPASEQGILQGSIQSIRVVAKVCHLLDMKPYHHTGCWID